MLLSKNYISVNLLTYQPEKSISIAIKNKEFIPESNSFQTVTSVTNPYVCLETQNESDILYINEDYFIDNYAKVISDLCLFIRKYPYNRLTISSTCFITMDILNEIRNNTNIMFLTLGNSADPFTLTKEVFDYLNESPNLFEINTDNVDGKFEDQDKMYISWFNKKNMSGVYNIIELESNMNFHFDYPLRDSELYYLRTYIADGSVLNFHYMNYDNIVKVIQSLKGKSLIFYLPYTPDILKYDEELLDLIHNGVKININDTIDAEKMLVGERLLDLFIKDIKNSSLSFYRKYLAIYQLVKNFKTFQKNPAGYSYESRDVYQILFNDFIVCEGYVNLLVKLLDKVGIPAMVIYCTLKKEKEELTLEDQACLTPGEQQLKMGDEAYHARLLVHLIDEEMDINGYYVSDPTWDSEENSFQHVHMTPFETTLEDVEFKEDDADFLNVNNSQEFLNKVMNNKRAISFFKDMFHHLDLDFYIYLDHTYNFDNIDFPLAFYLDIYNYIITFTKNSISSEKFKLAFKDVLNFIYVDISNEKLDEIISKIVTFNNSSWTDIVRR